MANISAEIASIQTSSRGEDVRDNLVSACKKINNEVAPSVSVDDAGKVLSVSADGKWVANAW